MLVVKGSDWQEDNSRQTKFADSYRLSWKNNSTGRSEGPETHSHINGLDLVLILLCGGV